jgi:hypothetical protein
MTGAAQPIEWYLARDDKQFGPLSDAELLKLLELRHLKQQDLVWRAGFTDWTPAGVAFPQAFAAPSAPAPVQPAPIPAPEPPPVQAEPEPAHPANIETLSDYRARIGNRTEPAPAATGTYDPGVLAAGRERASTHDAASAPSRRMWIAPVEGEPEAGGPNIGNGTGSVTAPVAGQVQMDGHTQVRIDPVLRTPVAPSFPSAATAPAAGVARTSAGLQSFGREAGDHPQLRHSQLDPRGHAPAPGRSPPIADPGTDLQPRRVGNARPQTDDDDFDDSDEDAPRPHRRIWGLVVIIVLLATMGAATWLLVAHPEKIKQLVGSAASGGGAMVAAGGDDRASRAARGQAAAPAKARPAAAMLNFPESATAIDEQLQAGQLWQIVRTEFPDWYAERVRETARLVSERKPDEAITKHLVDALISLRRKNAEAAFQASHPKLQMVARSFRDALEQLVKHSQVACYALVSSGEGSRGMIALIRDPTYSPALQASMTAVFEAVSDGRASPTASMVPRRSDYDTLTRELTALGWSEQDLAMFADPQSLAQSPPERVCKMVREWFTAHLAIQDKDIQLRLLIESLKPVVAG